VLAVVSAVTGTTGDKLDTTCSVCLDTLNSSLPTIVTGCNHTYHKECLGEWLIKHSWCPLCRTQIPGTTYSERQRNTAALRSFIRDMDEITARQYFRLYALLRQDSQEIVRGVEAFMGFKELVLLEAAINDPSSDMNDINLSEYTNVEQFINFKVYLATRRLKDLPYRLTASEYLETSRREMSGFELSSLPYRVSYWLTAIARLSVEEYSRSPKEWIEGHLNIIEDVRRLKLVDQISFRLMNVVNYRDPIDVGKFLDRMMNLIFRKRYGLFDDLTEAELMQSKKLMSCAGFTDYMTIHEMEVHLTQIHQESLETFIQNFHCIWEYMQSPYRMRISSKYLLPETHVPSQRPVGHNTSCWEGMKKWICGLFGRTV
jgi:hypothetical protein